MRGNRTVSTACTNRGVCGKDEKTAALQDLLVHAVEGLSTYVRRARQLGAVLDRDINRFVVEALFLTLTNVNFDPERLEGFIRRAATIWG